MRQIYTSDMNDEPMHMNLVQRQKAIETKEIGIPRKGKDDDDEVDEKKGVPASQGKRKTTAEGLHIRGLGESSGMGAVVEGQEHSGMTLLRTWSTLRGTTRRRFIGFWNLVNSRHMPVWARDRTTTTRTEERGTNQTNDDAPAVTDGRHGRASPGPSRSNVDPSSSSS
jgi:hypothetical protein